jgi:Flp pilus assembly protein TadD
MTDAAFPDRLTQLRAKWEADPTSRVFLQLAEEYRHLGRVKEGLAVLEKGLKEHPGYLSALVAKGRCHLELGEGEAARAVLERVVKQDATQMVANKLLVRAYLETGEPGKARERLDLYSLLNDSDPEIEELRRRIKSLDRPAPAEEPRRMDADPFSLEPVPRRQVAADVFDIDLAPPPLPKRGSEEIFPLGDLAPPPAAASAPPPPTQVVAVAEEEPEPDDLLFPGLASRDSRRRYLEGLAAEGLFAFMGTETVAAPTPAPPVEPVAFQPAEAPPVVEAPPPAPPEPEPVVDESAWLEEAAVSASSTTAYVPASIEPDEPTLFIEPATPAPIEEDLWGEEPEPFVDLAAPAAVEEDVFQDLPAEEPVFAEPEAPIAEHVSTAEPIATATLGELYLRQGYLAEAERIFQEVLQHEPDNASARAGLAHLAEAAQRRSEAPPPPLDAQQLLAGFHPSLGQTGAGGVTARKIFLLQRYLERIQQGGQGRDVS